MAKKNKRGIHDASVLFADETETNQMPTERVENHIQDEKPKSFWSALSRGGQVGVIALLLFVAIGAMGAGLKYLEDSAKRQKAVQSKSSGQQTDASYLSTLNPFVEPPPPTPTPQLSKEYIYAGSRMLAVEDANANAAPPTDLAVWRPSSGYWCVMGGTGSQQTFAQWGLSDDLPMPGDYDGDGKTDFSVYRPTTGYWYVSNSSNGNLFSYQFGAAGDKPAPADYDGDGKTDMAVYRQSNGYWYITRSSDQAFVGYQWGVGNYTPVSADFDGDGKADIAVWYNAAAQFLILKSTTNYNVYAPQTITFGHTDDKPVVGDFDGDGKADAAVWRPVGASNNEAYQWQIRYSSDNSYHAYSMGDPATDKAVQNDYDGDGKVDVAIWRPSDGTWYIQQSSLGGQARNVQWGLSGDEPVPAFYRR